MKRIANKGFMQKIMIFIVIILLFNFIVPTSSVKADESYLNKQGGTLFNPIRDFLVFLADAVLNTLQTNFVTKQDVVIEASSGSFSQIDGWAIAGIIIGAVLLLVGGAVIVGAVAGAAAAAGAATGVFASIMAAGQAVAASHIVGGAVAAIRRRFSCLL